MITNIVMLVRDRERLTKQVLDSIAKNTDPSSYNLTIIDDYSKRPLVDWYEFRADDKRIGWTQIPHTVLRIERSRSITGQARNLGVYFAEKYWGRGDYLYLTDNDTFNTPGWLETMVDMMHHCDIDLLGGWNHPFLQPKLEIGQKAFGHVGCAIHGHHAMTHDAVAGASQLMRWETWDTYGPLDAHGPGVGQSEDWKFCQDIQMPIVADPNYHWDGHDVMTKGGGTVGSIYPRVVFNCGITNSLGQPSPGADLMHEELVEAKKQYPDLYWQ